MSDNDIILFAMHVLCYCIAHRTDMYKESGWTFYVLPLGKYPYDMVQISAYRDDTPGDTQWICDGYTHGFAVSINNTK